jgi:hypothetical protein
MGIKILYYQKLEADVMISIGTIFTVGGIGLAMGMIDIILKSMGKEGWAMFLNMIALAGIAYYAFTIVSDLFIKMASLFL